MNLNLFSYTLSCLIMKFAYFERGGGQGSIDLFSQNTKYNWKIQLIKIVTAKNE